MPGLLSDQRHRLLDVLDRLTIDADDGVSRPNFSTVGRRIGRYVVDAGSRGIDGCQGSQHVRAGIEQNRQQDVHQRTGNEHQSAYPAAFAGEASCDGGVVLIHTHKATQGQRVDGDVSLTPFPQPKQARRIAKTEFVYPHAEYLGCDKMPQLVHEYQQAEYNDKRNETDH